MNGLVNFTQNFQRIAILGTADLSEKSRILGFDLQLLIQTLIQGLTALALFYILGRILFNPVREMLRKRNEHIAGEFKRIEEDTQALAELKSEYEGKLANIHVEADQILAHARKRAIEREDEIIKEARDEAERVMKRAALEIEREREQATDAMRREIIEVATVMASKFVAASMTDELRNKMVQDTLSNMGESTWTS